eukprot:g6462.t1
MILIIRQSLHYLKEFSIVTLTMSKSKFKVDLPASSRFAATQVTTGPKLGSGAFGTVFRGDLQMDVGSGSVTTPVAVKTVKSALITEEQQRDVMVECATHMKLNHPNVVQCFGWTIPPRQIRSNQSAPVARLLRRRRTTQNGGSIRGQATAATAGQTNHEFGQGDSLWVLVELMDGGGLDAYLAKHRENDPATTSGNNGESKTHTASPGLAGTCTTLPESWRVLWAAQIASAIAYIHSQGILHRDIAARNVVLSLDSEDTGGSGVPVAKVTDFGLSRCTGRRTKDGAAVADTYYATVDATSGLLRTAIPFPWTAPECLELTETKHESQSQPSSAAAADSRSGRSFLLSRNRTRVRPTVRATPANDVWAFGVLLWEIETGGAAPFKGLKESVMKHVRQGGRLIAPASASPILERAMQRAWEPAESRPPMKDFLDGPHKDGGDGGNDGKGSTPRTPAAAVTTSNPLVMAATAAAEESKTSDANPGHAPAPGRAAAVNLGNLRREMLGLRALMLFATLIGSGGAQRAEDYLRTVDPATPVLPPEYGPRYSCLAGRGLGNDLPW